MSPFTHLVALLQAALKDRSRLALENVALRQQLAVLRRSVMRPKLDDKDRLFWIAMLRTRIRAEKPRGTRRLASRLLARCVRPGWDRVDNGTDPSSPRPPAVSARMICRRGAIDVPHHRVDHMVESVKWHDRRRG